MKPEIMKPEMIARTDVEDIIQGLKPKTLANLNSLGEGPPYYKIGHKVYYRTDELIEWATRHKVRTYQRHANHAGIDAGEQHGHHLG